MTDAVFLADVAMSALARCECELVRLGAVCLKPSGARERVRAREERRREASEKGEREMERRRKENGRGRRERIARRGREQAKNCVRLREQSERQKFKVSEKRSGSY